MINKIKKNHKIIIIIPARLKSSRLSKKLLRTIHGKPMIQRVAEHAKNLGFKDVIVATDSDEIFNLCKQTKIRVIMSLKKHESGTDRVYEAYELQKKQYDIIINLQGDLPLFDRNLLDGLIKLFDDDKVQIGTAVCNLENDEVEDENIVKAKVLLENNIGYVKDFKRKISSKLNYYHHIGVYAFRPKVLKKFINLNQSKNEVQRKLEQLRAMDNNLKIKTVKVDYNPPSVDTINDLRKIRLIFKKNKL
ncbi:MAG: manno-octulosonate cytidylyltransferase [Alphaproteobacteria bacterium]